MGWCEDAVRVEDVPVSPVPDAATATAVVDFSRFGSVLSNANAAVMALHVITPDIWACSSMDGARVSSNARVEIVH